MKQKQNDLLLGLPKLNNAACVHFWELRRKNM